LSVPDGARIRYRRRRKGGVSGPKIGPDAVMKMTEGDAEEIRVLLSRRWGSERIVTRARQHDATKLPGWVVRESGRLMGLITLSIEGDDCEVVTIDSVEEGRGIGSVLLDRAETYAHSIGCERMWLVTTNDNLRALYFYQRRGFRIIAIHRDAVEHSRELKPEIPLVSYNGIPILDEIELEKPLRQSAELSSGL
jgi:GNAT superfamily N-acetyltransferase